MTEPWQDVARRLVAHPRFEWREGMKPYDAQPSDWLRCVWASCSDEVGGSEDTEHGRSVRVMAVDIENGPSWGWPAAGSGWHPDLTDWPTFGALFGMLADTPMASLSRDSSGIWWFESGTHLHPASRIKVSHPVPGAAVALALIAAWEATP